MTTRSQSVDELDRKIDENHTEMNSRFVELREMMNALNANMDELRTLIISQARGLSLESNNNTHPRNQAEPN